MANTTRIVHEGYELVSNISGSSSLFIAIITLSVTLGIYFVYFYKVYNIKDEDKIKKIRLKKDLAIILAGFLITLLFLSYISSKLPALIYTFSGGSSVLVTSKLASLESDWAQTNYYDFFVFRASNCNLFISCSVDEINDQRICSLSNAMYDNNGTVELVQDQWLKDELCPYQDRLDKYDYRRSSGAYMLYLWLIFLFYYFVKLFSCLKNFFDYQNQVVKSKLNKIFSLIFDQLLTLILLPINAISPVGSQSIGCDMVLRGVNENSGTTTLILMFFILFLPLSFIYCVYGTFCFFCYGCKKETSQTIYRAWIPRIIGTISLVVWGSIDFYISRISTRTDTTISLSEFGSWVAFGICGFNINLFLLSINPSLEFTSIYVVMHAFRLFQFFDRLVMFIQVLLSYRQYKVSSLELSAKDIEVEECNIELVEPNKDMNFTI